MTLLARSAAQPVCPNTVFKMHPSPRHYCTGKRCGGRVAGGRPGGRRCAAADPSKVSGGGRSAKQRAGAFLSFCPVAAAGLQLRAWKPRGHASAAVPHKQRRPLVGGASAPRIPLGCVRYGSIPLVAYSAGLGASQPARDVVGTSDCWRVPAGRASL